jgi:hypothetical protein
MYFSILQPVCVLGVPELRQKILLGVHRNSGGSVVSCMGVCEGVLSLLEVSYEFDSYSIKMKIQFRHFTFDICDLSIPHEPNSPSVSSKKMRICQVWAHTRYRNYWPKIGDLPH